MCLKHIVGAPWASNQLGSAAVEWNIGMIPENFHEHLRRLPLILPCCDRGAGILLHGDAGMVEPHHEMAEQSPTGLSRTGNSLVSAPLDGLERLDERIVVARTSGPLDHTF